MAHARHIVGPSAAQESGDHHAEVSTRNGSGSNGILLADEGSDPTSVLAKPARRSPETRAATAAEVAVEREFKARHYSEWTRQPVPALGGATPLEAVRKPGSKRKVELLLKEFENHESRLPNEERFDVSLLRRELGLDASSD